MDPTDLAARFLDHCRGRGAALAVAESAAPPVILLRSAGGPDIPVTPDQFRGRVAGFLADAGVPATPDEVDAVARAVLDRVRAGGRGAVR